MVEGIKTIKSSFVPLFAPEYLTNRWRVGQQHRCHFKSHTECSLCAIVANHNELHLENVSDFSSLLLQTTIALCCALLVSSNKIPRYTEDCNFMRFVTLRFTRGGICTLCVAPYNICIIRDTDTFKSPGGERCRF